MRKYIFLSLLLPAFVFNSHSLNAQYISTVAGNGHGAGTGSGEYTGDGGYAYNAGLYALSSIAVDGAGNIYIADKNNHVVRKINTLGIISTFAGKGIAGYSGDDSAATSAKLNNPYGVAVDGSGTVYISDNGNNVIRMVNLSGIITTFAGTGVAGYGGDLGPANMAKLNSPQGIAVDDSGWVYIADANNNRIRRITTGGLIESIAGTGTPGYTGNGGLATNATLHLPTSVAVDVFRNVYITDYLNNVVRKIDALGNISTIAGDGTLGFGGDGGMATSAQLHYPSGVSVDDQRNVYIADQGNNAVRKVDSTGIITNFAGTHTNGYSGDGGLAVNAKLSSPRGVTADGWGRVYIADYDNNVVRMVASYATISGVTPTAQSKVSVYPNPSTGIFNVQLSSASSAKIVVTNILGQEVKSANFVGKTSDIDLSQLSPGTYFLKIVSGNETFRKEITIVK